MVVFTCQHCGDTLRKPAVEKHYKMTRCRNNNPNLTCVDCLKDFFGDDYVKHTSCISEAQKYAAKGTVLKEDKGKVKQEQYVSVIQTLLSTDLPFKQKQLVEHLANCDNVPRKKSKFLNFIRSSYRKANISENDINCVFDLIDKTYREATESEKTNNTSLTNSPLKTPTEKLNKSLTTTSKEESIPDQDKKVEENGTREDTKENQLGLSRKELKQKKKQEKYLKELENAQAEATEKRPLEEDDDESDMRKKKKKSKKTKTNQTDATSKPTETNQEVSEEKAESKSSKSKKRKLNTEEASEVEEKRAKSSPVEEEEQTDGVQQAFDWSEVIIRVLESKPDKELSLKKLSKKVVTEYQSVKADHRTYDELMAKFNKKIKKTRNVRVLKDKAKLVVE